MLLKNIFSYSTINMLNASVPFFLLPILTAYLSTDEYGYLSVYQLLIMMLLPFITINIASAVNVEYFKLEGDELEKYISSVVVLPVLLWLLFSVIFYFASPFIEELLHLPSEMLYLLPTFALMQHVPQLLMSLSQVKIDIKMFAFFKLGIAVVNFLVTLLFVITFLQGWEGRLYAILVAYSLFTAIGIYVLHRYNYISLNIQYSYIKNALAFGMPLIPHTLAATLLSMADRLIMAKMLKMEYVGIYSVAFQLSAILMIVMASINQAWVPHLFAKLKKGETENHNIVRSTYLIMSVMLLLYLLFLLVSPFIFDLLIDSSYEQGKTYIKYIALGFLFQGFYLMSTNFLFFNKKTSVLSSLTILSAIINIILSIYFIKQFGAIGSAYAMSITWILFWILTWITSQKYHPMPWLFQGGKK